MPIIISQTYEIVTEESAEYGDAAERGFDLENVEFGFRELVDYISDNGFTIPSDSHGAPRWLSTDVIQDSAFFEYGEHRTLSLHPGNDARSQRYWAKACRANGLLKDWVYFRDLIKDAHYRGLRALVTYREPSGSIVKGLATHNATKGVGPQGVWFVCVNNFVNRVALSDVVSVKQVEE